MNKVKVEAGSLAEETGSIEARVSGGGKPVEKKHEGWWLQYGASISLTGVSRCSIDLLMLK